MEVQIVFVILIIVLVLALVYETMQYKQFLVAKNALMGMGNGMQEGFNQVVGHLNKLSQDNIELRQGSALTDQELTVIRTILSIHSKQLDVKQLDKMFDLVDKLKEIEEE